MHPGNIDECFGCMYEESDDIRVHLNQCGECKRAHYDLDIRNLYEDLYSPTSQVIRMSYKERIYDCNDCSWLNITEEQQNRLISDGRGKLNHTCQYYRKQVFHKSPSKEHNSYLYPCIACIKDKFKNYIED